MDVSEQPEGDGARLQVGERHGRVAAARHVEIRVQKPQNRRVAVGTKIVRGKRAVAHDRQRAAAVVQAVPLQQLADKRIMRVRPQFNPWAMSVNGLFIEDAGLNINEFKAIVDLAGLVEGIGDNRVNGYGRFVGEVVTR